MDPRQYPPPNPMYAQNPSQNGSRERIAAPSPLRPATAAMNRAEIFEDEKRRIMSSCFAKKDESGQLLQSYITHIRVEEDGQYPSAPPPPDAPSHHKKNRVIIVAVKNTGRVWMHKARENEDSTFQIGKSWPLEELQGIQSFSIATAQTPEEQRYAQWAGSVGFIITMSKPYYWSAKSTKEKEFFIGSLVKIYGKYTSGNVPQLVGFEPGEKDAILRGVQQSTGRAPAQPPGSRSGSGAPAPPSSPARPPADTSQGAGRRQPSYDQRPVTPASRSIQAPNFDNTALQPPPPLTDPSSQRAQTPDRQGDSSRVQSPASFVSSMHSAASPKLAPQGSRSQTPSAPSPLPSSRSLVETDGNTSAIASTENLASSLTPSVASGQLRPNGQSRQGQYGASSDSLPIQSNTKRQVVTPDPSSANGAPQGPPERKRPPMQASSYNDSQQSSTSDLLSTKSTDLSTAPPQIPKESSDSIPKRSLTETAASTSTSRSTSQTPDPAGQETPNSAEESNYRPGLGPMMGQKKAPDLASKLRKAATAYNAFKPRAGGAGERLLGAKNKISDGPDGVTEVVPAPGMLRRDTGESDKQSATVTPVPSRPETPLKQNGVPDQDVGSVTKPAEDSTSREIVADTNSAPEAAPEEQSPPSVQKPPAKSADRIVQKRRSNLFQKSLFALGIDPWIIEGKEQDYEEVLREFGWGRDTIRPKQLEAMEMGLKREIGRMEAGGWLGYSDQKDDRVEAVEKMLDKAIAECDEMEGLLTLYGVELGTLHDDIAFIEAQSQGLQVQTANQKLLQSELQKLVNTISIERDQLAPLRGAKLDEIPGLEAVEQALMLLYNALSTIDPVLVQNQHNAHPGSTLSDETLTKMKALREKKGMYIEQSSQFLARFTTFSDTMFNNALMRSAGAVSQRGPAANMLGGPEEDQHDEGRKALWPYSPLMLYAKEVNMDIWGEIIRAYVGRARPMFKNEVANSIHTWQRKARKPTGDEQEALFTHQEKEGDGLSSTARKLTVKRSATLARGLRSANLDKRSPLDKNLDGTLYPAEIFSWALDEMVPIISSEQHFFVDFFHANSQENLNFADAIEAARPSNRRLPDLTTSRQIEPSRTMAKRVTDAMEDIFGSWPDEMQKLAIWATDSDKFQSIGILAALERRRHLLEDGSQEFIVSGLQKIHEKLCVEVTRFVDEQIRAIEDTKVKIKKRKGVIGFIKVFPHFAALVESMLPPPDDPEKLEVRTLVDDAYNRINKAMFDSLKVIAKESPGAGTTSHYGTPTIGHSADSEDKEALNYHILLIENMFHFYTEVDERGDGVLGKWRGKAMLEMSEHQESYVKSVIRRPLGKLYDFVESTETLLSMSPTREAPTTIPAKRPSHSRSAFKKILGSYDAKEIRRGADTLKKRVEKHFGEADDPSISHKLVTKVLEECERHYVDLYERLERIIKDVYEGSVEAEFARSDISQAFRR